MSELLLHEIVDRMGKDLSDSSDSYIDTEPQMDEMPSRFSMMTRASKDLEAEQMNYNALMNDNPHPSLRDQEYLRHSALWGHHYVTGGSGKSGSSYFGAQLKSDATLPAYCNPPNPCPVGYTEEQGCITGFENTAAFSREFQASQECMCDGEHMFDCQQMNSDLKSYFAKQLHMSEQKNMVAKKFEAHQHKVCVLDANYCLQDNAIIFRSFLINLLHLIFSFRYPIHFCKVKSCQLPQRKDIKFIKYFIF